MGLKSDQATGRIIVEMIIKPPLNALSSLEDRGRYAVPPGGQWEGSARLADTSLSLPLPLWDEMLPWQPQVSRVRASMFACCMTHIHTLKNTLRCTRNQSQYIMMCVCVVYAFI